MQPRRPCGAAESAKGSWCGLPEVIQPTQQRGGAAMLKPATTIQKCAWGFAALFLGVYLLDFVPGIMDEHGLMFGLFQMTRIVDLGHLALGALALVAALISARAARIYFVALGIWYSIDVATYFASHLYTLP